MKNARPMKSLKDRIIEAEERAARWLAKANEAAERGDPKAGLFYAKSQFWLDRSNQLRGW